MPIYEYRRSDGTIFEVIQSHGEEPLVVCPSTGLDCEKMISKSNFQLKGGGWSGSGYMSQKKPVVSVNERIRNASSALKSDKQHYKNNRDKLGEKK